ncbi:hypothetical protein [Leisingera daeponensis]|uniref:hypothetical protein n=1 Tax=Leisingera daeponensis TaxID=405746 RepID=UPI001C961264|nr:hypothetical protein [Leisingera daeponensis]MBY6055347.1 hypothetical protein [Leisingera daeponensis]
MPSINPKPFDAGAGKTGFSISVSAAKSGQFVRLGFSEAAQRRFFGGSLNPETDAVILTLYDDPGKTHLLDVELSDFGDERALRLSGGARGSVSIKLAPWAALAPGKRPSTELPVVSERKPGGGQLKLPEWARPPARKIGQGKPLME